MKLQTLIEELERQYVLKWDQNVRASDIRMLLNENEVKLTLNNSRPFSITEPCHIQIAEKLEIPIKYYHKMASESPGLLVENVNTWLQKEEKDFFLRGMGDCARPFSATATGLSIILVFSIVP